MSLRERVAPRNEGWRTALVDRVRVIVELPLYRNATGLAANSVATAAFGVVFWIVAARLFSKTSFGEDSALVNAMIGVSTVAQLGFSTLLPRFLPTAGRRAPRTLLTAYALSGAASLVLGGIFLVVAPRTSTYLAFLATNHAIAVVWLLSVVIWCIFALEDSALTAFRCGPWLPLENGSYGLLKIVAAVATAALAFDHGILLSYCLPLIPVIIPVNWLLFTRVMPKRASGVDGTGEARWTRRQVIRFFGPNYSAGALSQLYSVLLPLFVITRLGANENAVFYVAFTVAISIDQIGLGLSSSLLVEGAHDEEAVRHLFSRALRGPGRLLIAGIVVGEIAAPLLIGLFGHNYHAAAEVLRILLIGSLGRYVVMLTSSVARVEHRYLALNVIQIALALMVFAGALVATGNGYGIVGVAGAWAVAHLIAAGGCLLYMRRSHRRMHAVTAGAAG
jgi:O-antigen/teichoic acid export membrane protein